MTTSPSCFAAESLTTPSLCLCRLSISKIKPERVVDPSLNLLGLLHPSVRCDSSTGISCSCVSRDLFLPFVQTPLPPASR
uniref:Uncharacterized protein n=1 Tax=Brassica oleracea var. oleracea TaxID=109376 RepID=A0A0D3AD13_BRAOL